MLDWFFHPYKAAGLVSNLCLHPYWPLPEVREFQAQIFQTKIPLKPAFLENSYGLLFVPSEVKVNELETYLSDLVEIVNTAGRDTSRYTLKANSNFTSCSSLFKTLKVWLNLVEKVRANRFLLNWKGYFWCLPFCTETLNICKFHSVNHLHRMLGKSSSLKLWNWDYVNVLQ